MMKRVPASAKIKPVRVRAKTKLTHVGDDGRPKMVDVGSKNVSLRSAMAIAIVRFPAAVARELRASGMRAKKGPVVDTAIVAGSMAVKRTHDLIPFCHPLAIERCDFSIDFESDCELAIRCEVGVTGKTGVEMEALTGAAVAALTVYDMCKALSHEIVIANVRLLDKAGGRRNVRNGKIIA